MLTTVICNQCHEAVSISNRNVVLPYVCIGCQAENGSLTSFGSLAGGYAAPGTFADKTGTYASDAGGFTFDEADCVNCAYDDCAGCEPQEPMDESSQLIFDMQQQIDQFVEQIEAMDEELDNAKVKAHSLQGALEATLEMLAKAFLSLGEKEAEVLKAQDAEEASHRKLAEMMHERDEARKELAKYQQAIYAFNREFNAANRADVPPTE